MYRRTCTAALALGASLACRPEAPAPGPVLAAPLASASEARADSLLPASATPAVSLVSRELRAPDADRVPNTMGRIPILEYHLIGQNEGRWERHPDAFRRDLELLYERGYRPITVAQLIDGDIRLPAGLSPVVVTFDDASPSQFRYIERDGRLDIDSTSAVGIWLDFNRKHPDWSNSAVFCMLSGAEAGRSFFGDKPKFDNQKAEWRMKKVRFLAEQGFELCNHTLWHANLSKYSDAEVQEQIARGVMAIDSAVPGYRVRTFALPLGAWPKNRDLAQRGEWKDPKSGRTIAYDFDAVLLVAGNPVRSPRDSAFNPLRLERVQVMEGTLPRLLDNLDRPNGRYVSDGMAPRRGAGADARRGAGALR